MTVKRKQALLVTREIVNHLANTEIQMDLEKELDEVMKRLSKLEDQDWGFYETSLSKGNHDR
jgi:hypothetical protein